ncbi:hypothetical protein ACIPWE_32385 [Streptomyces sp. NPDC090073]|uniref:hypothetical protein n=1 Tax=Streptomyces sp. NPDC090073 TaxID=3365936 RepID=UPI00380027EE
MSVGLSERGSSTPASADALLLGGSMSRFGRRRHAGGPHPAHDTTRRNDPPRGRLSAFELSAGEYRALVRVIEHAQARLALAGAGDTDTDTIRNASGAELLPSLRARADAARDRGADGVPMLATEVRHLEAAVVNLESYGGHEAVLCEGYTLLEECEDRQRRARSAHMADGILTLDQRTPPAASR